MLAVLPKEVVLPKVGGVVDRINTDLRLVQLPSAPLPMLVTLLGNVMLVSFELVNAAFPTLVTLSGMVISGRLLHALNAEFPMVVSVLGRVTLVRFANFMNVPNPRAVMPSFTTKVLMRVL